ncbi:MAG: 50S ribosomal protein L9 [Anaerolineales bacterium]
MLIKDVYKLGRAGDVKKVADGYGRNYLVPQGLAVLATPGALKQVERIRSQAEIRRAEMNKELQGLSDDIEGVVLTFAAKAGETGKLYGSITTQNVADALQEKTRYEVKRHQIDTQPIRNLGEFAANVRLTMDLVPEIKIIVYREGESPEDVTKTEEAVAEETPAPETAVEETPVDETPAAEDTVAEETPAPEAAVEETLVDETPAAEGTVTGEAAEEETPATEEPVAEEEETPVAEETPVDESEESVEETSEEDKE